MQHTIRWGITALFAASSLLAGCKQAHDAAEEEGETKSATVEHLEGGSDIARITLTEDAAKRLQIETASVENAELASGKRDVIPYAAILYDTQGETWTFTNPEPLVYVRHHVLVDHIDGDRVVLADVLPPGTAVVTVGAAELYGSEIEFEEE